MIFGLTRGEIALVAFIFGLVYVAGLLPKIAARLGSASAKVGGAEEASKSKGE